MTNYDVVKKLVGMIRPIGDASYDEQRLKNLKKMCELSEEILTEIVYIRDDMKGYHEASIKETVACAEEHIKLIKEIIE